MHGPVGHVRGLRARPERARALCRPPHRRVDRARDGGGGERRGHPYPGRGHGGPEQSSGGGAGARDAVDARHDQYHRRGGRRSRARRPRQRGDDGDRGQGTPAQRGRSARCRGRSGERHLERRHRHRRHGPGAARSVRRPGERDGLEHRPGGGHGSGRGHPGMAGAESLMQPRRALAIGGSIALHVGALAGLLLLAASLRQPEPLFVDLTTGDLTPGARAGDERLPAPRTSPGPKTAAPPAARVPSRASARAAPQTESTRPAEIVPAPGPVPPLSGEMTTADPPPSPVADPPADGARSATPAAPGAGAGSGVASDAPTGTGQGSSTGGGSRLALAGPGAGRSEVPAEFGPYLASFRQRIQELVVYPLSARRRGLAGKVEVEVVLEPSGRVRAVAVVASSSHAMLDDAALDAVRSLPPVPLPENLPRRPLRVRLPIVFDLR